MLITALVLSSVAPFLGFAPQVAHATASAGDVVFNAVGGIKKLSPGTADGTLTTIYAAPTGHSPYNPTVSPNGSLIAFSEDVNEGTEEGNHSALMVMNSDGSGVRTLSKSGFGEASNMNPSWSPDGQEIAYSGYKINVNSDDPDNPDQILICNSCGSPYWSWSPDGTRLTNGTSIMYADGTGSHWITGSAPSGSYGEAATWSPDGSRIYNSCGEAGGICYYGSSDGFATTASVTLHQLPLDYDEGINGPIGTYGGLAVEDGPIQLSRDGSTLVYSDNCHLYVVSSIGGSPTTLTNTSHLDPSNTSYCTTNGPNNWPSFTPPSLTEDAKNLLALGDSVAAGEGINDGYIWTGSGWVKSGPSSPTWTDTTEALGDNHQSCHQSDLAYNRLFSADDYHVRNMACTGATALDLDGGILKGQAVKTAGVTVDTVSAQLGGTCTGGCESPNSSLDFSNTDVVTLTVGANDIDFATWLAKCYVTDSWPDLSEVSACGTTGDNTEMATDLSTAAGDLHKVLSELNRRAGLEDKHPTVLVTNYYMPLPSTYDDSCVDVKSGLLGLTEGEFNWIKSNFATLNSNIASEVTDAQTNDSSLDVRLVDISNIMQGGSDGYDHSFCSSHGPWVHGPSIAYDDFDLLTKAPYHPTIGGQQAIYKAAKKVLDNSVTGGPLDYAINGTFEGGAANGWNNVYNNGSVTPSVSTTVAHSGSNSMTFTGSFDVTDSPNGITATSAVDVDPVDFWAKGPSGKTIRVKFRQYLTGGNNELYQSFTLDGNWDHFTTKALHLYPGYALDLNFDNPGASSGDVYYLDDVHEYGYTATETCGYDNLLNGLNADAIENCGGEAPYGTQFWAAADSANPTLTADTDAAHDGSYSFKLVAANSGTMSMNDSPDARDTGEVATSATSCTATAWMKGPSTAGSRVLKLRIREYNANQGGLKGTDTATATPNGSWQQLSITRTLASGHDANTHLDLYAYMTNASANDVVRVDHITETCQ